MDGQVKKLKELIEASESILLTSHISPDPDAISSLLLMGTGLLANYPDKKIRMVLEEEPVSLKFIEGYEKIEFKNLVEQVADFSPDLIILLDGNNFDRASRHDGQKLRDTVKNKGIKTVTIDHHELTAKDEVDIFINRNQPATVQTVYELLFQEMGLKEPIGAMQTAMVGYYADTGGFVYLKDGVGINIFRFVEELVAKGADIEKVKNQLEQYTRDDLRVISELADNLDQTDEYSYSYISDNFVHDWLNTHSQAELQQGTGRFLDSFIRNIEGRRWGFIVYRNTLQGDNFYSVSLRSVSGVKDVAAIANRLGGGGHKAAAGAKVQAKSVLQAVDQVKAAILTT